MMSVSPVKGTEALGAGLGSGRSNPFATPAFFGPRTTSALRTRCHPEGPRLSSEPLGHPSRGPEWMSDLQRTTCPGVDGSRRPQLGSPKKWNRWRLRDYSLRSSCLAVPGVFVIGWHAQSGWPSRPERDTPRTPTTRQGHARRLCAARLSETPRGTESALQT